MGKVKELRVTPENSANLRRVTEASVTTLTALGDALEKRPTLLTRNEFIAQAEAAGLDNETAEALTKQVVSLRNLAVKKRDTLSNVLDALETSLQKSELTKSDLAANFPIVRQAFERIASSEAVGLLLKSIEVFGDQISALTEARVFTEIRPIFTENRDAVVGAAVFNRLRLEYQGVDGYKAVELTIDSSNLDLLAEQLEMAKKKTRVLKDLLKDRVGVQRIYTDESDFGE